MNKPLALIVTVIALVWPHGLPGTMLHRMEPVGAAGVERAPKLEEFRRALLADLYLGIGEGSRRELERLAEPIRKLDETEAGSEEEERLLIQIRAAMFASTRDINPSIDLDFSGQPHRALNPDVTLELPPIQGSMILGAKLGDGPVAFRVTDINLARTGDSNRHLPLEATPGRTTVLLMRFQEIPAGENVFVVQYVSPGAAGSESWARITGHAWATLSIDSPRGGNLDLRIVDSQGDDTPALVRLTDRETGRYLEPPNAIDARPIMTEITGLPIYGPGKGYTHFIPGDFRGTFWVVPGGFEVLMPPGEWELEVYKGYEHIPVRRTLQVEEGGWTRETVVMEPWIDMRSRGWHSGDDHVHSRLISSKDAFRVMTWARAVNVQVINVLQMGDTSRSWYEQRGFGPDFRVHHGDHVLVPGQEDPRSMFGHNIALNTSEMVRDTSRYLLTDWLADEVRRQGGLYGQTHVGEGYLGIEYDMALIIPTGRVDFASIMQNTLGSKLYYDVLDLGFRLTASAGSDTPYGGSVGVSRLYVHLGEGNPFDVDAWFEGLRAGNSFVTNGPMLHFVVDGSYIPGDELFLEDRDVVRIQAEVLGRPHGSSPRRVAVVYNGETIHEQWNDDAGHGQVAIEMELEPGKGGWLALTADGFDGSNSHTTPVYLVREGFRHWNYDRVPGLIDVKLGRLDEIERLIEEHTGRMERGEMSTTDHWFRQLVEQADGIRNRVAVAREYYEGLIEVWEKEAEERD